MPDTEAIEGLIRPVVEGAGLELVEVEFRGGRGRGLLRVTVDREGGVDLDSVAEISERVSRRLDVEGFDPGPYTLEVSSPGIERPLRRPADFSRRTGGKVKVSVVGSEGAVRTFTGTIVEAGAEAVTIATDQGVETVPYRDIARAHTVFEWPATKREG